MIYVNNNWLIFCKKQFKLRKFTHNNKIINYDTFKRGDESPRF